MPGGNRVGRVYYDVDAENNVSRGLAAAEGEAQAFTQRVSAMEAEIEVDADLSQLKKDAAEVAALKKAMEAEKIEIDIEVNNLEEYYRLGNLSDDQAKRLKRLWSEQERYNGALKQTARSQRLLESQMISRKDEARRIKDVVQAEKQHARALDATSASTKQQALEVAKLEEKYSKLFTAQQKAEKLDVGRSRRERIIIDRIRAERELVGEKLLAAGRTKRDLADLDVDLERNRFNIARWGQAISQARIHLGFFSTTLAGLTRLMVVFGPVVTAIGGALGSLISVAGAGLAGALAVGGAAFTGFGLAAIGSFIALKPAIQQMDAAFTATKALSDAQLKYGKNSSQAKDKQEQLNNTLKGMDKPAREAFQSLSGMRTQFDKLAGVPIRKDFFGSFAEGIKTAKALLPTFARGSRDAFHAASQGFNDWMKGMRSAEGKNILNDIMQNFAKSIPNVMDGLGSLGATMGRIFQAASTFLPSLSGGFADWAQSIEDGVGSGDQLVSRVGRWVSAMQKVGHFTQAAASALSTFFSIGIGPGGGFLDGMTRSLKRWNNEMKADPTAVRNFFQRGVDAMEQFGPAVGRALGTLLKGLVALEPALIVASTGLNLLFDLIGKAPGWFVAAAGGALLFSRALKGIAAISGLTSLLSLFGGLGGAGAGAAGGGIMARIFGRGGATVATRQMALFGAEMGALPLLLNPYTAAAVAAGVGTYFLVKAISSGKTNAEQATDAMTGFASANRAIPRAIQANVNAQNKAGAAWTRYNKLAKEGKGDSKAASQALIEHARAQNQAVAAQQKQQFETDKQHDKMVDLTDAYNDQKTELENLQKTYGKGSAETQVAAQEYAKIGAQLRLATLNYNRLKQGAAAATPAMLQSLQAIKKVGGRQTALKFRFDDQQLVQGVGRLSSKLSKVDKPRVIKILANADNANQAYSRLIKLDHQVKDKKVNLSANDGASGKVAQVKSKIDSLKDKVVQMKANDAASSKIAAIQSKINSLHDRVVTITTYYQTRGNPQYGTPSGGPRAFSGGVFAPGYAAGGVPSGGQAQWVDRMMDRAYKRADQRTGIRTDSGAKVTSPRYVVGEQAPRYNEFIITENPAYRLSNLRYLQMAAESMGRQLIPGFASGKGKKKGGGNPLAEALKRKKTANKKKGIATGASAQYNALSDDVDYWAEEFSLDRNAYDNNLASAGDQSYARAGFGGLLGEMLGDIDQQITAYRGMQGLNPTIQNLPEIKEVKGKLKKEKKQAKLDKRNEKIAAYNDARDEARDNMMSNRDIEHAIRALEQEALQIQTAAVTGQPLGTEEAGLQMYSAFTQYGSNISNAVGAFTGLASGIGRSLTPPSAGFGIPGSGVAGASASSAMSSFSSMAAPPSSGLGGDQGVTVINNFASVPPDPLTWSQGTAFELSAL